MVRYSGRGQEIIQRKLLSISSVLLSIQNIIYLETQPELDVGVMNHESLIKENENAKKITTSMTPEATEGPNRARNLKRYLLSTSNQCSDNSFHRSVPRIQLSFLNNAPLNHHLASQDKYASIDSFDLPVHYRLVLNTNNSSNNCTMTSADEPVFNALERGMSNLGLSDSLFPSRRHDRLRGAGLNIIIGQPAQQQQQGTLQLPREYGQGPGHDVIQIHSTQPIQIQLPMLSTTMPSVALPQLSTTNEQFRQGTPQQNTPTPKEPSVKGHSKEALVVKNDCKVHQQKEGSQQILLPKRFLKYGNVLKGPFQKAHASKRQRHQHQQQKPQPLLKIPVPYIKQPQQKPPGLQVVERSSEYCYLPHNSQPGHSDTQQLMDQCCFQGCHRLNGVQAHRLYYKADETRKKRQGSIQQGNQINHDVGERRNIHGVNSSVSSENAQPNPRDPENKELDPPAQYRRQTLTTELRVQQCENSGSGFCGR